jgi:hypothetical protein
MPVERFRPFSPIGLEDLSVEGFKSYETQQTIRFAPLTLIFGSNASGKSSLMQALRLLGLNANVSNAFDLVDGMIKSRSNGLDLGDFLNYSSGHKPGEISFGVTCTSEEFPGNQRASAQLNIGANQGDTAGHLRRIKLNINEKEYEIIFNFNGRYPRANKVNEVDESGRVISSFDASLRARGLRIDAVSSPPDEVKEILRCYRLVLRKLSLLVFIGPHREQLPRVAFEDDLGLSARLGEIETKTNFWTRWLAGLANSDEDLDRVNEFLQKLEIPYRMSIGKLVTEGVSNIAITGSPVIPYFVDLNNGASVFAKDIGYGVSQVLPIVMACALMTDLNYHLMIEQPELHLHPRLQGALGNLLVEAAQRGQQVTVETHSEHLILRVQKLIRMGLCDSSLVSVVFVERTSNGPIVHDVRMNEIGDFIDDWPGGFFEERLEDLF